MIIKISIQMERINLQPVKKQDHVETISYLKPLSDSHKFPHDMPRVSASYNSAHIAKNVHEFRQNCSTSVIQYVHDIHNKKVGYSDPVQVIRRLFDFCDMCTRSIQHSLRHFTSSCEFVRVLHDQSQVSNI